MIDSHQVAFMQQLGRSYRALVAGFETHTGHTMARWRVMVLLDARGEMSQKLLARQLGIDPAALTRQLKALERDGWVERHNDVQDARLTNVALTDAGRATVTATMERRDAYIEWVLGEMTPAEMDAFSSMLAKLESRVAARSKPLDA